MQDDSLFDEWQHAIDDNNGLENKPCSSSQCSSQVEGDDSSMCTLTVDEETEGPGPGYLRSTGTGLSGVTHTGSIQTETKSVDGDTEEYEESEEKNEEMTSIREIARVNGLLILSQPTSTNWEKLRSGLEAEINGLQMATKGSHGATSCYNGMRSIVTTLKQEMDGRQARLVKLSGKDKRLIPDWAAASWETKPMEDSIIYLTRIQGGLTKYLSHYPLTKRKDRPRWPTAESAIKGIWSEFEACKEKCTQMDEILSNINLLIRSRNSMGEEMKVGQRFWGNKDQKAHPDDVQARQRTTKLARLARGDLDTLLSKEDEEEQVNDGGEIESTQSVERSLHR